MSNKQSIRWSSAVILHSAYQMRLYSPSEAFVAEAREELCDSLEKYSEDTDLRLFLNLDEDSGKSILHTNIPCYFNKRNRSWSNFFMKREFMEDNMSWPDDIEKKILVVKKSLLSFTIPSVDNDKYGIRKFFCDDEYLKTINESIQYLMNDFLLKVINNILEDNIDIGSIERNIEDIEREINFIEKKLLEKLQESDLVDIEDTENTQKITENFTEHIKDLVKGYKPEKSKTIKDLIEGIKKLIEKSRNEVCESLRKKLGYPDEYDPEKNEINIYDLFLYIFLRFSSHATWYENGIAYTTLDKFKKAYNEEKNIMPICWYMKTIEEEPGKKLVDIILYDKKNDKKNDNYYIDGKYQSKKEKIPDVQKPNDIATREYILNTMRDEIYMPLFSLFNQRDNLFIIKGSELHVDSIAARKGWWKKDVIAHDTVVIPMFETYINGIGYGRLQGIYSLYREDQKALLPNNKYANEIKAKIAEYLFKTSKLNLQDISEKTFLSDIMRARKKISNKSDEKNTYERFNHFFKYFLEIISYCQDWENIWLVKRSDKDHIVDKVHFWWGRGQQSGEEISSEWKDLLKDLKDNVLQSLKSSDDNDQAKAQKEAKAKAKAKAKAQKEAKAAVKKVLDLDKQKCYELAIEDCDMFSKKDFEVCNTLPGSDEFIEFSDCEIVLEYPEYTIFPPAESHSDFIFKVQMKERLMRIIQMAYDIWKTNIRIDDYQKARGYIIQMSHNLYHALTGMSENLEKTVGPMEGERHSSPLLDPDSLNDNSTEEQKLLLGSHNFLLYLRDRFESFTLKVPGKGKKSPIKIMIDEFNKQVLFKKYITWVADDSKTYDVELVLSPFSKDAEYKVCYDILYMFLENYIRNVVKHSDDKIVSNDEPIRCNLEITTDDDDIHKYCISIWEDSIKNIPPKEFLKKCQELEDIIEERYNSRPFKIDRKGTSAMVCLVDSLCERVSKIEVNPVFVVPGEEISGEEKTSTRHEVEYDENKKGYYYKDKNKKEQRIVPCKSTNGDEGYRLSMEYRFKMDI